MTARFLNCFVRLDCETFVLKHVIGITLPEEVAIGEYISFYLYCECTLKVCDYFFKEQC